MSARMRMADALLRSVGGRQVLLRIPAPALPGAVGEQIGLGVPGFQDVALGPVVFRKLRPAVEPDGVAYELLISASAVLAIVGSLEYAAAAVLFGQAAGVVVDGALLEIAAVTCSEAFGVVYLWRLRLLGAGVV